MIPLGSAVVFLAVGVYLASLLGVFAKSVSRGLHAVPAALLAIVLPLMIVVGVLAGVTGLTDVLIRHAGLDVPKSTPAKRLTVARVLWLDFPEIVDLVISNAKLATHARPAQAVVRSVIWAMREEQLQKLRTA